MENFKQEFINRAYSNFGIKANESINFEQAFAIIDEIEQLSISDVVGRSEQLCNCDFFIEQGYEHSISEKRKNKCEGCNKPIT